VAIDFALTEDLAADGDEATSYGAFLVLDRPGGDFDDLFAILTGARVKF
jgi:hypothetical protein